MDSTMPKRSHTFSIPKHQPLPPHTFRTPPHYHARYAHSNKLFPVLNLSYIYSQPFLCTFSMVPTSCIHTSPSLTVWQLRPSLSFYACIVNPSNSILFKTLSMRIRLFYINYASVKKLEHPVPLNCPQQLVNAHTTEKIPKLVPESAS